jgi:hypothetical protein
MTRSTNPRRTAGKDRSRKGLHAILAEKKGITPIVATSPTREAVSQITQEEHDPFVDAPDNEPDFQEPALAMILDAHWEAFGEEELAEEDGAQIGASQATVNVLADKQLDPRLPRNRTPFSIHDGFVAPFQPNGPNPEPVMAPLTEQRQSEQQNRSENRPQRANDRSSGTRSAQTGAPLQAALPNQNFPAKWVPIKELIRHCPPNLINDLK